MQCKARNGSCWVSLLCSAPSAGCGTSCRFHNRNVMRTGPSLCRSRGTEHAQKQGFLFSLSGRRSRLSKPRHCELLDPMRSELLDQHCELLDPMRASCRITQAPHRRSAAACQGSISNLNPLTSLTPGFHSKQASLLVGGSPGRSLSRCTCMAAPQTSTASSELSKSMSCAARNHNGNKERRSHSAFRSPE